MANPPAFAAAAPARPAFTPPPSPYANPAAQGQYQTQLSPDEEATFQGWVQANHVPFDPSPQSDYDMRGFFKALVSGDPRAKQSLNSNDGRMHFPDVWKTPFHKSFSAESQYATKDAPRWNKKDQLVDKTGKIVFDERGLNNTRTPAPALGQGTL